MAIIAVELEKGQDCRSDLVSRGRAGSAPASAASGGGAFVSSRPRGADPRRRKASRSWSGGRAPGRRCYPLAPTWSAWVESDRLLFFKSAHTGSGQTSAGPAAIEATTADAAVIESGVGSDALATKEGETEAIASTMTAAALRRSTRCVALAQMALDPAERRKVDRYLDVTKSAMLFGGRVLLIEGDCRSPAHSGDGQGAHPQGAGREIAALSFNNIRSHRRCRFQAVRAASIDRRQRRRELRTGS